MIGLRRFEPADLPALYAISLATELAGADAAHLYRDPRLLGHIYTAPYAILEPALAYVARDRKGVAGFVLCTHDTDRWARMLEQVWWPGLRRQYPDPSDVPPAVRTPDYRRTSMIHHPEPAPPAVIRRFPAHLHMNLLPRLQRRGIGSRLLVIWLDAVATHGASAVHVGVDGSNERACQFWTRHGFVDLQVTPPRRTRWLGRSVAAGTKRA